MMKDRILDQATELRDAIEAQTAGLMNMLRIQAAHGAMLKEILQACTAEPEGESPLVSLIKRLVAAVEAQSGGIARIEQAVERMAQQSAAR